MYYVFNGYQFDSNHLLLSQQGQVLPLRNNDARLLHFFLSSPPQVYSKTQILDAVWHNKVVGEQAVFQAISNLRQQFGDSVIRTFAKKGYQWQWAVEMRQELQPKLQPELQPELIAEQPTAMHNELQASHAQTPAQRPAAATAQKAAQAISSTHYRRWLAVSLLLIGLTYLLVSTPARTSARTNPPPNVSASQVLLMMQFFETDVSAHSPRIAEQFTADLRQQLHADPWQIIAAPSTASEAQLWASPQLFIPKSANASSHQVLLTGRLTAQHHHYRLWVALQGSQNRWQYRLQADSMPALQQQLVELLHWIVPPAVLWQSQDQQLVHAQWQLLQHQAAQLLPLQQSRVQADIRLGDLSAAELHSEQWLQQAQRQQDLPQQVLALQQQAEIALQNAEFKRAHQLLDRAGVLATRIGDAKLLALHLRRYFPIWYAQGQFEPLEAMLLQALQLARSLHDEALVVDVLLDLTIASFKFAVTAKQHDYFIQTQNQLNVLRLAPENTATLELFSGINSRDKQLAERLFLQALQRFSPQQTATSKSQLQQQLVSLYLQQQQPNKARALFKSKTEFTAQEHYLLATIANSQHLPTDAQHHASAAFVAASLAGQYSVALDASLLLLQHHAKQPAYAMYRDYLRQHATPAWRQRQQQQLQALAL